ncbi:MAG: NAD(+)/NADH kinase [Candidatus Marinimicrobia bacterium]|jgi:NAD+ kinase|nr:NAD(+)/NADH kinase [Candidatus Neomarinimicrobiota bacterium]
MIIGLTGNFRKSRFYEIVNSIFPVIVNAGHSCFISSDYEEDEDAGKVKVGIDSLEFSELVETCDIILTIGGDGTLLSTARRMEENMKPILGIHIGGLGFLAESTRQTMAEAIEYISNQNYSIENRMMLSLHLSSLNGKSGGYHALNDIVVDHGHSGRILKTEITVSGEYLNTYESDGLIFSTPTGSTAYSLSAGGPIITPTIDTITVTPICPHSLSARPIVLPANEIIEASFTEDYEGIACTIDGQIRFAIKGSTKLEIKKSSRIIQFISLPGNNYFHTLRSKMGWTGNLR